MKKLTDAEYQSVMTLVRHSAWGSTTEYTAVCKLMQNYQDAEIAEALVRAARANSGRGFPDEAPARKVCSGRCADCDCGACL